MLVSSLRFLVLLWALLPTLTTAQVGAGGGSEALTDSTLRQAVKLWASGSTRGRQIATQRWGVIEQWDVSSVTDMSSLFMGLTVFNDDISAWDVSSVTSMAEMFSGATAFNQDLSNWDVGTVQDMSSMFENASAFQGAGLSKWDVSNVDTTVRMFYGATGLAGDSLCWTNLNLHLLQDVADMFCGTNGMGFDPCCTDTTIIQDSCCAGDNCNTACADQVLGVLVEAAQGQPTVGNYGNGNVEVVTKPTGKPGKQQDFPVTMATEPPTQQPTPTLDPTPVVEPALEGEPLDELDFNATLFDGNMTNATNGTGVWDEVLDEPSAAMTEASPTTVATPTASEVAVMAQEKPTTEAPPTATATEAVATQAAPARTTVPATDTTAPAAGDQDLFGSLMDNYQEDAGASTEAPQSDETSTTTATTGDQAMAPASAQSEESQATSQPVVTGNLWATLVPIILFILIFIVMIGLMTYYGLAQGNPGYVVPTQQKS